MILSPLQKLPKNVGDSDKIIVAKGFKNCPKSNKSHNLVTLKVSILLFTQAVGSHEDKTEQSWIIISVTRFDDFLHF